MLKSIKNYVYERKNGIVRTAGFVGGVYVVQSYVSDRLEELRARMDQERIARENLRRRFQTSQDDVSFTVLAVLPTLAEQVMEGMDVEALTRELQTRSKARTSGFQLLRQTFHHGIDENNKPPLGEKSTESAARDGEQSEAGSTASTSLIEAPSRDGDSSGVNSWVETSASVRSPEGSSPAVNEDLQFPHAPQLSDSVITLTTTGSSESRLSDSVASLSTASDSASSKTKAELWAEVKMLTFTRTLTTLYSMTLLSLLTTIQLSILARFKYVNSVLELEREERLQDQLRSHMDISFTDMLFGDPGKFQDFLSANTFNFHDDAEKGEMGSDAQTVTEEVERKFLTLSWWVLHVGWKDVGERVRRGVEEVFEGVSLKTKLAAIDLHRLIRDVRRRVEHEITFEGQERRVNFLSTLLPPTPEMIQHVLVQGGFISESSPEPIAFLASEPTPTQDTTTLTSSQLSHDFDASPATGLSGLFDNPNNPFNVGPSTSRIRPPIPNVPRANCHQHSDDACIDCASISHILPEASAVRVPQQTQSESRSSSLLHAVQDPPFLSLVEETRAVIKSPDFGHVLEACLDRATGVLMDGLEKDVFVSSESAPGEEVRIRLAGLLPGLARWSRLTMNGLPNELVDTVLGLREVTCLSAIVFSKFEEKFS